MLVLGSRGRGHIKNLLLGSTSVALVRHAYCPVVVHRSARDLPQRGGIAVGVDASPDSKTVLDIAFRLAQLHNQPLTVVRTQLAPTSTTPSDPHSQSARMEDGQVDVPAMVERFRRLHPAVTTTTVIGRGQPENLLLDLAEQMSLLVVGVHQRSRPVDMTFASVAVWLVEQASCPVLAVPLRTDR